MCEIKINNKVFQFRQLFLNRERVNKNERAKILKSLVNFSKIVWLSQIDLDILLRGVIKMPSSNKY